MTPITFFIKFFACQLTDSILFTNENFIRQKWCSNRKFSIDILSKRSQQRWFWSNKNLTVKKRHSMQFLASSVYQAHQSRMENENSVPDKTSTYSNLLIEILMEAMIHDTVFSKKRDMNIKENITKCKLG